MKVATDLLETHARETTIYADEKISRDCGLTPTEAYEAAQDIENGGE